MKPRTPETSIGLGLLVSLALAVSAGDARAQLELDRLWSHDTGG